MNPGTHSTYLRLERVITETLGANLAAGELEQAARLDDLVAIDSVSLLEFCVGVEREFGIRIERARFTRDFFTDLPALAAYLTPRAGGESPDGEQR
jgi:acyl carrier protein